MKGSKICGISDLDTLNFIIINIHLNLLDLFAIIKKADMSS